MRPTRPDCLGGPCPVAAPVVPERDTVGRGSWGDEPATGVDRGTWEPVDEGAPKTARGVVRVFSRGSWEVSPLPAGGSRVVYQSHAEIGDSVPRWLIERMLDRQIIAERLTVQRILEQPPPSVSTAGRWSD